MIAKRAEEIKDELTEIRRTLHRIPETDFTEFKTSEYIQGKLREYGIPFEIKAVTGISALIEGTRGGKTVLLRADMDGLPIKEESGVDFASENEGYMHACGHDIHAACLLGAAKILNEMRDSLCGNVRLIFQPAEEGMGGALPMIEEGIMENPHVDGAFALHGEPLEKVGNIQIKDGSVMASPDDYEIIIHGIGGHGAYPEKCVNPLSVGAAILEKYHTLSRDYNLPCVVTICSFNGGSCRNAVPDTAVLTGTARSLDPVTRKRLIELLEKTAQETAKDMGASVEFNFNVLFPPVINSAEMNKIVSASAKKLGLGIVHLESASMAGDDFAYFGERVPSAYFKLGVGNKEIGACYPIHSPKFKADENALPIGAALMAQTAVDFLNERQTCVN
ncbi:MAG: M20 family metallopeptidase [Oscillospiraceae bacterium]|nr:M20 family metallopeptidase [Oscillospiraceae bacterium]